jgi:SAM-dependent methyltransferase
VIRSPNIWDTPEVYELENLASDRAGVIDTTIEALHPLEGATLLDVGCGTGFHLPRLAGRGARVVGIEPHPPLVRLAAARLRDGTSPRREPPGDPTPGATRALAPGATTPRARVVAGDAEALPLADGSVDVAHARWAYFFGPGCEPGLRELERVVRPGGVACLVDNDATRSTFGAWFVRAYPAYDPVAVQRFWDRHGFTTERLTIDWTFDRREDLEAVVRIELPPGPAEAVLEEHRGLVVDYAVALRWRRF